MAIKINFDSTYNAILPTFVLAQRYGNKLGAIPATNIVFKDALNNCSEISFSVNKVDTELWNSIKDFQILWCKEWNLWFEIYVETDETNSLIKHITAKSLGEAELSQVKLYGVEINTEEDIAREDYDENNPTVFYNITDSKISMLDRLLEKAPHYRIKYVDLSLAPKQYSFSFDDISIYDAFQKIAEDVNCLFVIEVTTNSSNEIERNISVYDLEAYCLDCGYRGEFIDVCPECGSANVNNGYGNDTNIFISSDNLADEIKYSTNVDSVKNCFRLTGGDDLMTATIANCNPNGNYIWYLSDELKSMMSPSLVSKIEKYEEDFAYYQNDYIVNLDSGIVQKYNNLMNKYDKNDKTISAVKGYANLMNLYYDTIDMYLYLSSGLMPSVDMEDTTAIKQANSLYSRMANTFVAVTDITKASESTVNSAVLNYAKTLIDSRYQIKISTSTYNKTTRTWHGKFVITNYSNEDDTYTNADDISISVTDNYRTYIEQVIDKSLYKQKDEIDIVSLFNLDDTAFQKNLKLYCLARLNSFHDACQSVIDILIEQGVADSTIWVETNDNLYQTIYMKYYRKLGYIEDEIRLREEEINLITGEYSNDKLVSDGLQTLIDKQRSYIKQQIDLEKYLGTSLWEEFASYRREDTYNDENCISDGCDNAELFNKAQQFLETARIEIFKSATLQHQISATLKNLLVIKDFQPIIDNFEIGNWIRLKVDDKIYRLRLIEYTIDFDNLQNLQIVFSDVAATLNGYTDLRSILSQASSMATSYDSVSRQAAKGSRSSELLNNWVERGLSVTATKIMNSADEQTQTWDEHGMLFRKYDSLNDIYENTQLKIINSTIAITDDNWKTVKTAIGGFYYYDVTTGKLQYAYGVNAETVVGKLILGEQMKITNAGNSLSFTQDGLKIQSNTAEFKVTLNENNLVTISNNTEPIFYVDSQGVLHIKGDGAGLDLSNNSDYNNLSLIVDGNGLRLTQISTDVSNLGDDLSQNYYTKSEIQTDNTIIYAGVEKRLEDYYTKSQIAVRDNNILASVQSTLNNNYYTKSEINLNSDSIISTVQDDYNNKITKVDQKVDSVTTTVTDGKGESTTTLTADAVKFAWNNISQSVKIEGTAYGAQINIYNSSNVNLMKLNTSGLRINNSKGNRLMILNTDGLALYNNSQKIIMELNSNGQDYYNNGTFIGSVGTNQYRDTNYKGIVFDLANSSNYMAWAWKENSSDDDYTVKWTYVTDKNAIDGMSKNTIHAGCDINMHKYKIENVEIGNTCVAATDSNGTSKLIHGFDGSIPIITGIGNPSVSTSVSNVTRNSDNAITNFSVNVNVSINYTSSKLRVKNGLIYGYWN